MLSISDPITASQAQEYHRAQYSNAQEAYYSQGDTVRGEWHGTLAKEWGLVGEVTKEQFVRLINGQHPLTGQQLVRQQPSRTYTDPNGKVITTCGSRACYDLTFSMDKTGAIAALPGGDSRLLHSHRNGTNAGLDVVEPFIQARLGGDSPPETTGKMIVVKFEHDSARPVNGEIAPLVHTHCLLMNITQCADGTYHAIQPLEVYRGQNLGTASYRAEVAVDEKELGYEVGRSKSNSPVIQGFSDDYIQASSPRSQEIKNYMEEHGVEGPEAAQITDTTESWNETSAHVRCIASCIRKPVLVRKLNSVR
jgi:conjugative relaxase-like TrwC/TraI family protein